MAFERLSERKTIATNLESFIASQLLLIKNLETSRNLEDESQFTRSVLEDNLTLEDQLLYRKDQLKRVRKGNKEEKRRIREAISTLKDQIEQKKFSDSFIQQVDALNSGMQSIEKTLNWLNQRLTKTTDEATRKNIRENISTLKQNRYSQQKATIESQTKFANEDKSEEVINRQVERVNKVRAEAVRAGNEDYVSLLDLQLQSLNKSLNETKISKSMLDLSVSTMTGQSSLALLNALNNEIENADPNLPITIGNQKYDSAQDFWNSKRIEYLNDRTSNGFFQRYNSELVEKVQFKATKGILNNDSFADVQGWYDFVKDRPELGDYQDRIATDEQASLKTVADARSTSIINEFAIKLDAKKAINDLSHIQDTYGVDMTTQFQKVIQSAAAEKEQQVREILSTMQQVLKNNPSLSNQQALEQAIKAGAGAQFSPEELATTKASDIITDAATRAEEQQFGEDELGVTVSPTEEGKTFAEPTGLQEGDFVKSDVSPTVFKFEGGKIRAMVGSFDEASFKKTTGKSFGDIKVIKNVTGIPTGTPIKKIDTLPPPEELGEKILNPEQLKVFKPEDIITRGTEKFIKAGVKSPFGKRLGSTEFSKLQKETAPEELETKIIRAGKDIFLKQ